MITLLLRLWFFSLEARGRFSRWDCRFWAFATFSFLCLPCSHSHNGEYLLCHISHHPSFYPSPPGWKLGPFFLHWLGGFAVHGGFQSKGQKGRSFQCLQGLKHGKRRKADGGGCGGQTKELGGDLYKVLEADGWGVTAPSVNPSSWIWLMAFFLRWAPPSLYKQTTASASGFGFMSHLLIPHFHVFTIHFNRSIILHIYTLIF